MNGGTSKCLKDHIEEGTGNMIRIDYSDNKSHVSQNLGVLEVKGSIFGWNAVLSCTGRGAGITALWGLGYACCRLTSSPPV